jgi:hypothetical protein
MNNIFFKKVKKFILLKDVYNICHLSHKSNLIFKEKRENRINVNTTDILH